MILLNLPRPPSTNQLWRALSKGEQNGYRQLGKKPPTRVRTDAYRIWLRAAKNEVMAQNFEHNKAIAGFVSMQIAAGAPITLKNELSGTRPDISNLIKGTEDLLVTCKLIDDDKCVIDQRIFWTTDIEHRRIQVCIQPAQFIVERKVA